MNLEDIYRLLRSEHVQAQGIVDTVRNPLLVLDQDYCVLSASRSFFEQQFSFWRPDKIGDSGRDGFLIQDRDGDAVPPSELAAAVL
jgi:hypothetical protein